MQLSEIRRDGLSTLEPGTVARSPIRKAVYVYLRRQDMAHDLPKFYRELWQDMGIRQGSAQRMRQVVRSLGDDALDALDSLTTPATLVQCMAVGKRNTDEQVRMAKEIQGKREMRALSKRLGVDAPPDLEATFQGQVITALQGLYGRRVLLERRNVGQVVTRTRSGEATGVFKASQIPGAADYRGTFEGGKAFEIEFKAETKQRADQIKFEQRCKELGIPYWLWKAADGIDRCLEAFAAMFGQAVPS